MFLDRLPSHEYGDRIFYIENNGEREVAYSYFDLLHDSDRIASYLKRKFGEDKGPVVCYGHKDPLMPALFLASVKSGRPYCPLDISMPKKRLEKIIEMLAPQIIFTTEIPPFEDERTLLKEDIREIIGTEENIINGEDYIKGNDTFYIIFTSGSTGDPKGVEITYSNLENYINWGLNFFERKRGLRFLNQAPYSFDLSVMDLYLSLSSQGTLYSLDKKVQEDYKALLPALKRSGVNVWVSTPSFCDICLLDRDFDEKNMPDLKYFLFCGEVLTNETAKKLISRFPNSKIINTYGPTESTVCVTSVEVTGDLLEKYESTPIGRPKENSHILLEDEGGEISNRGEIIILGDTVSKGYFKEPLMTKEAFFNLDYKGKTYPAYRTGDLGYYKDGYYFCTGRKDQQIKLHGYRIELSDIEKNLLKIEGVKKAAVIPKYRGEKVQNLIAFLLIEGEDRSMEKTLSLKRELKKSLPSYMIPQRFVYLDKMPLNQNSKIDRKKLGEMI